VGLIDGDSFDGGDGQVYIMCYIYMCYAYYYYVLCSLSCCVAVCVIYASRSVTSAMLSIKSLCLIVYWHG
jgi:hypothetical protein